MNPIISFKEKGGQINTISNIWQIFHYYNDCDGYYRFKHKQFEYIVGLTVFNEYDSTQTINFVIVKKPINSEDIRLRHSFNFKIRFEYWDMHSSLLLEFLDTTLLHYGNRIVGEPERWYADFNLRSEQNDLANLEVEDEYLLPGYFKHVVGLNIVEFLTNIVNQFTEEIVIHKGRTLNE